MNSKYIYTTNEYFKSPKMPSPSIYFILTWICQPFYFFLMAINWDNLKGAALVAIAVGTWMWKQYYSREERRHKKRMNEHADRMEQLRIEEKELELAERRKRVNH